MPKLPGCARGITPLRPGKSTFLIVKRRCDRLQSSPAVPFHTEFCRAASIRTDGLWTNLCIGFAQVVRLRGASYRVLRPAPTLDRVGAIGRLADKKAVGDWYSPTAQQTITSLGVSAPFHEQWRQRSGSIAR